MINTYKNAYADIYYILNALEEEYRKKVPEELVYFFEDNANPDYLPKFDFCKPLTEQNISQETEQLICLLNLNYWCSPEEKEELLKKYQVNEEKIEEQLKGKYEIKFKINPKIDEVKAIVPIKKENIFIRIINFLKGVIGKKI